MGETSQLLPEWKAAADEIWAVLRENAEQQKETDQIVKALSKEAAERQKEIDRRFQENAEQQKETDQIVKALSKETAEWRKEVDRMIKESAERRKEVDRMIKELSKEVGGISNRLGEVAQCFFGSELWKHFDGFEYEFQQLYPYLPLFGEKNKPLGDIDITLLNGEYAMAIEVKTHLKKKNVEYHATRMEQIKQYPPAQYKGKKALAGLAALMIDPEAKDLADELGMYVLEQSGDAVRLALRPTWFTAREW